MRSQGGDLRQPRTVRVAELLHARNIRPGNVVTKHEAYTETETPWFRGRARSEGYLAPGAAAALSIRPEHVILHRRDRPLPESPDTVLDVEIDDEVPIGNNHRLYLRVLKDGAPTDCVIESDVPAHPYQVMGVGSRRDWGISLTLDEVVAIKS